MTNNQDNLWGIPIGKEVTVEALVRDFWDPTTEEVLTPKHFFGAAAVRADQLVLSGLPITWLFTVCSSATNKPLP